MINTVTIKLELHDNTQGEPELQPSLKEIVGMVRRAIDELSEAVAVEEDEQPEHFLNEFDVDVVFVDAE